MLLKRITAFIAGAVLLTVVIWLGFNSMNGPLYVLWFGLASAIFAPTGLAMIGYVITGGQQEVLQRLSKVPEIDKLIGEAKTQEERIRLLEQERSRLLEAVQLETRRQTLVSKKAALEQDGLRILDELQAVDMEFSNLEVDIDASTVKEEIERLSERLQARQRGNVIIRFGETQVSVDRELISSIPLSLFLLPRFFTEGTLRFTELLSEAIIGLARKLFNFIESMMDKLRRR